MPMINFSFQTKYGTFSDALNLPDGVNYADEQIEEMKRERLTNWLAIIEAPIVESTVSSEVA